MSGCHYLVRWEVRPVGRPGADDHSIEHVRLRSPSVSTSHWPLTSDLCLTATTVLWK